MVKHIRGVTLIELMVVLVIMSILATLGIPLTQRWIHGAQVTESQSMLQQGYDQARAVALRNPTGAVGSAASAGLKLIGGETLLVCRGEPSSTDCIAGGDRVVWATDLSRGKDVRVTLGGSGDVSVSLTNTGIPVSGQLPAYSVSKGDESIEGELGRRPE